MFQSPLVVTESPSWEWVLTEPLDYLGRTDRWVVPAGFETDFASVPRIFWTLIPRHGRYTKAAVIHDFLYLAQPGGITRKDADGVFRRIMREEGVSWVKRWTMYSAVRAGGFFAWRRSQKRLLERAEGVTR